MTSQMKDPRCPSCRLDYARRSRRFGTLEHFASWFYLYPFTCQLCCHRFLALQFGVRYAKRPVDKRQFSRFPVKFPAKLRSSETIGQGTVRALSMGGCEVDTDLPAAPGSIFELSLTVWENQPELVVRAAIVRSQRTSTVGLEFLKLEAWNRARLNWCIDGLLLHGTP